jgi:hypothetical protein
MNKVNTEEKERAYRISFMTEGFHISISTIYEKVVDKDYVEAKVDIINLLRDLRQVIKIMEDDDF